MHSQSKFLIFGGPGIGDTIIELNFAKALKELFPLCRVDMVVSAKTKPATIINEILHYQNFIDNFYVYRRDDKLKTVKVLLKLWWNKYDYGFSCSTAFKSNDSVSKVCRLIGCISVIKEIKGKTGKIDIPIQINEDLHIVEQWMKLLSGIDLSYKSNGLVLSAANLDLSFASEEIRQSTKKVVSIVIGSNYTIFGKGKDAIKKDIKRWPIEHFISLAERLSLKGYYVLLIGGEKCDIDLKNKYIINLCGRTTISESLAIINMSNIIVGSDTGMMHCAAALGKTTVTLFGGTNSNIWKPYSENSHVIQGNIECSPCYGDKKALKCQRPRCMDSISVDKVFSMIVKLVD